MSALSLHIESTDSMIIGKTVCFVKVGNTASTKSRNEQFDPNFC